MPKGWFFHGPSGTGKTTLAHIIARLVQGPEFPADAEPEIEEENAADNGKVADARKFAQAAEYYPSIGTYRVLIMDEMQQATPEAQNVFLKLLEDPKATTIYIFCTTDPTKIIPALRNRCLQYRLKLLNDKELMELLVRGWKRLALPEDRTEAGKLVSALLAKEVRAPRDILMALERFAGGMTASQAVQIEEDKPDYVEIAKAVLDGNWVKTSSVLKGLRSADVRGLRAVVVSFLKGELLNQPKNCTKGARLADCLDLFANTQFEDGVAFGVTTGVLWRVCSYLSF
jgi:replication-associated recombination protein RarA